MWRKANAWVKNNATATKGTQSLDNLVTRSENALSSQATVYTQKTGRSGYDGTEIEDMDDLIGDEIDTLFITQAEEKRIQGILELARKGKINAGNAFDLPVKVIDPQASENAHMRFWKFASELLFASMNIYDKRVENVFQNTNRMFDSLLRLHHNHQKKNINEDEAQDSNKRENMLFQFSQVGKSDIKQIAMWNCEDAVRINLKNFQGQFHHNPLFQKRMELFDSDSLRSLFLNVFECGEDGSVELFNRNNRIKSQKIEAKEQLKQQYSEDIHLPNFIEKQLSKINFILSNRHLFEEISQYKSMEETQQKQAVDIVRDYEEAFKNFQPDYFHDKTTFNEDDQTQQIDFKFMTQSEQPQPIEQTREYYSESNVPPFTTASDFGLSNLDEGDEDHFSEMTPWQLEFKGAKLQKKKNRVKKTRRQKKEAQPWEIDFDDTIRQDRTNALRIKSKNIEPTFDNKGKAVETFLIPKAMDPFIVYHKRYRNKNAQFHLHPLRSFKKEFHFTQKNIQNQNTHHNQDNIYTVDAESFPPPIENQENLTDLNSMAAINFLASQKNYSLKNIRAIKQQILHQIVSKHSIKIKDTNFEISPQSMLIIFLHLANEKNLILQSIGDEEDVSLSLSQF